MEVTLEQILSARESRAYRQREMRRRHDLPILSFTMNIPGPVKDTPLIRRAFQEGLNAVACAIDPSLIPETEIIHSATGCEALFAVDSDPLTLKRVTTLIEDTHPLGRLFDMDVLDENLRKLDRDLVNGGDRGCILCGRPGRECASRRLHPVAELQRAVHGLLTGHFSRVTDCHTIGTWAALSLLDEVSVTPKPGLVDRINSGSHRDMDLNTFVSSTAALVPFFRSCAQIGLDSCREPPENTFRQLRQAGIAAEASMLQATGGINTHKGAIFTLGILSGAAGRLLALREEWTPEALCAVSAAMTAQSMESDFRSLTDATAGGRLYRQFGIRGIRGEAVLGFPSVREVGLPVFQRCLSEGMDWNSAGVITLLHLTSRVEDTNMISRGGLALALEAREKAADLLPQPTMDQITELDLWFIDRNLSPGGCADLLAAVCFLRRLIAR